MSPGGAHEFKGDYPSRAGRLANKLGPGIIDADRLEELLGEAKEGDPAVPPVDPDASGLGAAGEDES